MVVQSMGMANHEDYEQNCLFPFQTDSTLMILYHQALVDIQKYQLTNII